MCEKTLRESTSSEANCRHSATKTGPHLSGRRGLGRRVTQGKWSVVRPGSEGPGSAPCQLTLTMGTRDLASSAPMGVLSIRACRRCPQKDASQTRSLYRRKPRLSSLSLKSGYYSFIATRKVSPSTGENHVKSGICPTVES